MWIKPLVVLYWGIKWPVWLPSWWRLSHRPPTC